MLESALRSILLFQKALLEDPRYKALKQAEANMEEDEEAKRLSAELGRNNEEYDRTCRYYGDNSAQAKKAYQAFYQSKLTLDSLSVVQEYQRCYNQLHFVFIEADSLIFGPFRGRKGCAK